MSPPHTFAELLDEERHRLFVGRAEPLSALKTALSQPGPTIVWVHGPGGIGKTTLLREAARSTPVERSLYRVDVGDVPPSPEPFVQALAADLGCDPSEVRSVLLEVDQPILVLDGWENAHALDNWFRTRFLPGMPASSTILVGSRHPPGSGWRDDRAWRRFLTEVALDNLSGAEAMSFLEHLDVPETRREALVQQTKGHPLALSLAAESSAGEDGEAGAAPPTPESKPHHDVLATLAARFLRDRLSAEEEDTLIIAMLARATTESLLTSRFGPDGRERFRWLRERTFTRDGRTGLLPHDLARDAIIGEITWRNPERVRRAAWWLHDRFVDAALEAPEDDRPYLDWMYLGRSSPLASALFDHDALQSGWIGKRTELEVSTMIDQARAAMTEGDLAALPAWLTHDAVELDTFLDVDGRPMGFSCCIVDGLDDPILLEADPLYRAVAELAEQHQHPRRKVMTYRYVVYPGDQRFRHNRVFHNLIRYRPDMVTVLSSDDRMIAYARAVGAQPIPGDPPFERRHPALWFPLTDTTPRGFLDDTFALHAGPRPGDLPPVQVVGHTRTRPSALAVARDGSTFTTHEGSTSLGRRQAARRLLVALAEARRTRPGEAIEVAELFAEGWPGQRIHPQSARRRVYTTIHDLRALGLGERLQTRGDGYLLDPSVDVTLDGPE